MQSLAQVGTGLRLFGLGPEEIGEALAKHGVFAVEQQVRKQGLQPRGVDRRDHSAAVRKPEPAKEPSVKRRECGPAG